jgi:hypothetical protein
VTLTPSVFVPETAILLRTESSLTTIGVDNVLSGEHRPLCKCIIKEVKFIIMTRLLARYVVADGRGVEGGELSGDTHSHVNGVVSNRQ